MPEVIRQLFDPSSAIRVREVELLEEDNFHRLREKLARIVMDEMYQFVGLLDANARLLEVNRAALEGAGIRLEDIRGKPFWEARWWTVSKDTMAEQQEACRRAAAGEFVRYDVEIYGRASGEETIIIDYSLIPVRDREGRVVFLLAEGRNITEKKQGEAEIARKNQELQQLLDRVRELDEIKSQFFANVSHELRTPLALILGPTEKMLMEGDNLTAAQRRDIEVVRRNASMLLKHVNDLLDLSKLDAGKMEVSYGRGDLAQLLRAMAGHFEALAPQRHIRFVVEAPDSIPAEIDADKVERVVLNLLSNAFKFVPDGGRIRCAVQVTPESRGLITVQDSGPGVPPEMRGAIFQRFRQADTGATRQFGGTGLGLSIAKDFVELHGGTISVTEAPDGGALFMVEIPLRAPEGITVRAGAAEAEARAGVIGGTLDEFALDADDPGPAMPDDIPTTGRPRVLVVEDNSELRRHITETLAQDFEIASAQDGAEGLEKAVALCPDLIITDVMMPRMSGDELVAALRQRDEVRDVPILVLSAKADDALRVRLLAGGAQDYVVKPFSGAELRIRASNLVSMKRARDVLRAELDTRSGNIEALAHEVTRRNQQLEYAAQALRESEAKFRTITETMPQIVWSTRPDGYHDYYNLRWYEFTGVAQGSTDGEGWNAIFHPEDQPKAWELWRHSLATGEPYEIEYRIRHHSGEYRWTLGRALPVQDQAGTITRWMGTCTDIHDLKQAQEHQRLLTAELSHRVKNALAVVQSITFQTLRRSASLEDFSASFQGRLQALSQAHDLLLRSKWTGVSLRDVVRAELAPYAGSAVLVEGGPEVVLDPKQAVALALILHELTTNAAKHGALAAPEGRLRIHWRSKVQSKEAHLCFEWHESGLLAVPNVAREGFGTRLISRSAQGELNGSATKSATEGKLVWTLDFPLVLQSRAAA
ncbi:PAS domain S-box protein [Rubellimicrobium rubrum]|uniref:histidine kinase n=1 Tax=Rubellimicrobium rubrum TaxID=2585369 RepID=A0A5C4MYA7_9RHOB|nr:ATP-binding protein [Rubellimicrobium rubrum]TNC49434.1 PAS domain S-box protein [Rubellimicrobium rubrum]